MRKVRHSEEKLIHAGCTCELVITGATRAQLPLQTSENHVICASAEWSLSSERWEAGHLSTPMHHWLEKEMATHSSVLAWRIPGTGEPGGLPSMGSHRVGHDWSDLAAAEQRTVLGNFSSLPTSRLCFARNKWSSLAWKKAWRQKSRDTRGGARCRPCALSYPHSVLKSGGQRPGQGTQSPCSIQTRATSGSLLSAI